MGATSTAKLTGWLSAWDPQMVLTMDGETVSIYTR